MDIKLRISLFARGKKIIDDSELVLVQGTKYGLVGRNRIGKISLLKFLKMKNEGISANLMVHLSSNRNVTTRSIIDYLGTEAGRILSGL